MGEDGGGCGGSGSGEVVQGKKQTGKVKWFNNMKGFGFITADEGGEELFVHQSSILCEGYRSLTEGEEVEFEVEEGEDQRTRAVHVTGPCGAPVQASNNSSRGNNSSRSSARGGGGARGGYSAPPSYGGYSGGGASQSYGGYSNNQSSYGYGPGSGCYNCGEIGHIARECPAQDGVASGSSRRGGRTCYTCGEMGHIARDCPSKDDPQDQIGRQFSSLTV